ncbi:hypothetical protein JL721_6172 [Aureococcus anophagefferens]|nr:hypothetical protein JL721_6172 [Aureococcus anophagefferens]
MASGSRRNARGYDSRGFHPSCLRVVRHRIIQRLAVLGVDVPANADGVAAYAALERTAAEDAALDGLLRINFTQWNRNHVFDFLQAQVFRARTLRAAPATPSSARGARAAPRGRSPTRSPRTGGAGRRRARARGWAAGATSPPTLTDLDGDSLAVARAGRYRLEIASPGDNAASVDSFSDLPEDALAALFAVGRDESDGAETATVTPRFRGSVTFSSLDLRKVEGLREGAYHLVFCRHSGFMYLARAERAASRPSTPPRRIRAFGRRPRRAAPPAARPSSSPSSRSGASTAPRRGGRAVDDDDDDERSDDGATFRALYDDSAALDGSGASGRSRARSPTPREPGLGCSLKDMKRRGVDAKALLADLRARRLLVSRSIDERAARIVDVQTAARRAPPPPRRAPAARQAAAATPDERRRGPRPATARVVRVRGVDVAITFVELHVESKEHFHLGVADGRRVLPDLRLRVRHFNHGAEFWRVSLPEPLAAMAARRDFAGLGNASVAPLALVVDGANLTHSGKLRMVQSACNGHHARDAVKADGLFYVISGPQQGAGCKGLFEVGEACRLLTARTRSVNWVDGPYSAAHFSRPHAMTRLPGTDLIALTDIDNRAVRLYAFRGPAKGEVTTVPYDDGLWRRLLGGAPRPPAAAGFHAEIRRGLWTDQLVDGGNGSCANIKWVNFSPDDPHNANNTQFHWHFVETSRKPTGPMSLVQLHGYQEWLHGNLSEAANPADELADMHMTLAAGSLDPFAELYRRDGVPFSPRARFIPAENLTLYSVLVEIPHGILVEIVSDTFASYDGPTVASGADDCAPRKIPTANAAMSYASTTPAEAAAFVERHMGGLVVDQELPAACGAEIAIGLNHFVGSDPYPFYIQWLHHPRAKRGYMDLAGTEAYLEALHGNLTEDNYDQYMDDHLGMEAVVRGDDSFGAFVGEWRDANVEWFHRMASWDGVDSFLGAPGGVILETMVAEANGTRFDLPIVNWDICSPLPAPLPKIPRARAPVPPPSAAKSSSAAGDDELASSDADYDVDVVLGSPARRRADDATSSSLFAFFRSPLRRAPAPPDPPDPPSPSEAVSPKQERIIELSREFPSPPPPLPAAEALEDAEPPDGCEVLAAPARDGDDAPAPAPTPPDAGPSPSRPSTDEPASPKARAVDDLPRREDSLANLASLERQPVKIVVSVHRARQLFNVGAPAKDMNPYCIVSYAGFEIKSRHEPATADPVWNLDAMLDVLVPFRSDDDSVVRLYFFSARTVFADRMLGKRGPAASPFVSFRRSTTRGPRRCEIALSTLFDPAKHSVEGTHQLMRRTQLPIVPCDTSEQDGLKHTQFSGTRQVQRKFNPFHDNKYLYGHDLGTADLSVFAICSDFRS